MRATLVLMNTPPVKSATRLEKYIIEYRLATRGDKAEILETKCKKLFKQQQNKMKAHGRAVTNQLKWKLKCDVACAKLQALSRKHKNQAGYIQAALDRYYTAKQAIL